MTTLKEQAREIFLRTLKAAALQPVLQRTVTVRDGVLRAGEYEYAMSEFGRVLVVAVGKAAAPMAEYVVGLFEGVLPVSGLVDCPPTQISESSLAVFHGGHPLPNEESRRAAMTALQLAEEADEKTLVLWLVSGGASAMFDAPLDGNISTADMTSFHRALVHSGLAIGQMNALRKHFSAVKGGRLAVVAKDAGAQLTLLVSDVPEGQTDVISSGPTLPDSSTVAECRELYGRLAGPLPESVRQWFEGELPETPKAGDAAFARSRYVTVLSSANLCAEAAIAARAMGFEVVVDNSVDDWPYDRAAMVLLYKLARLRQPGRKVALITAGELSVPVSGDAGVGGRNQHFALHMAKLIDGMEGIAVVSAGSDGIDGNSPAAGGVVDGETWGRLPDGDGVLAGFDSGSAFGSLGDAIVTGATGNNLRDLRLLLAVD